MTMTKRNIEIKVRLNKEEIDFLNKKSKKCGVSREGYIRMLLHEHVPKETPPAEYFDMMRELKRIGENLNQIAMAVNKGRNKVIDGRKYERAVKMVENALLRIDNAVLNPEDI